VARGQRVLRHLIVVTVSLGVGMAAALATAARLPASVAGASGPTVTGSGSSWAALALDQWVADVSGTLNVSYSTTSSVLGLNAFAQGQVDFGVSEIGYSTGQADDVPPPGDTYQYLPAVGGADCLMYNLTDATGSVSSLHLNSSVLVGIFTGQITSWSDPAIAALNPGASLPDTPITVVYRTEAAGDNYVFSDYLQTEQPGAWNAYTAKLGTAPGPQAIWPVPQGSGNYAPYNFSSWIGEDGSDNASNYVAGSNGSITYVETGYATEHNMPCASVFNNAGDYVQPSETNDAIALQNDQLQPDLEQNLTGVFNSPQPTAYPISAYGYFITQEGQTPAAIGSVLGTFLKFVSCQGQRQAGQLGYTPLPPNLVQDDFDAIRRINGAPDPGTVDATNCPNPYVTGSLAPVAGPTVIGQAPSTTAAPASGTVTTTPPAASTATPSTARGAPASGGSVGAPQVTKTPSGASASEVAGAAIAPHTEALAAAVSGARAPLQPVGPLLWWTLVFLAVLVVPSVVLLRRRGRAHALPTDGAPGVDA